jgi:predicted nucleotidyltransferase
MCANNRYSVILLLFLACTACNVDKNKKVKDSDVAFETTDNTVIFFKNLRQSYYDKQENTQARIDIYRSKKRILKETSPVINLAIAHHWRNDKAYIMIEPNELLGNEVLLEIIWKDTIQQNTGKYIFDFGDMEQHYRFATSLYQSIQDKHELQVKLKGEIVPLMPLEEEKEIFRKTMLDYLRLVNVVK